MSFTVLSPWAESRCGEPKGLNVRPESLDGKTIGLFSHFKEHAPFILKGVEALLSKRYPKASFSYFQYPIDTAEMCNDERFNDKVVQWAKSVDVAVCGHGDAGSCALFLAYNVAYLESLGVPTVTLVEDKYRNSAARGAAARQYPGLRMVDVSIPDLSSYFVLDDSVMQETVVPALAAVEEQLVGELLRPLSQQEAEPPRGEDYANRRFTGTYEEINKLFYNMGWTNGTPIVPPTEAAVEEMLTGTDLPRDYVVAEIPPMLGKATVEKIAINAVMAGCLPTYMPVLIAAVRGMMDPKIHLEGWTCSNASWIPLSVVSGKVARDINMNSKAAVFSPYYKANSAIPRALAYIVMNISGVRYQMEDMSAMGCMNRFGVTIAENGEASPWPGLHTDYGFAEEDSAVTLFWPAEHCLVRGRTPEEFLRSMCNVPANGWFNGCALVISPESAKMLAAKGWTKQRLKNYMVEYNRIPSSEWNLRWLAGNNHMPDNVEIPADGSYSARRFWNDDHMFIVVAGGTWAQALTGGGDHGGPSCTKIELPANWDELVTRYKDDIPHYINY